MFRGPPLSLCRARLTVASAAVRPLITQRFPGQRAKRAFDLLYEHPDQAMGVLLVWE